MKEQEITITTKERSELFGKDVITVILLLLLNLSIVILLNLAILNDPHLENGTFFLKKAITLTNGMHLWSWQRSFVGIMLVGDAIVVYWRLVRRYRQVQSWHVIEELYYIADGHFDHRIPFVIKTDLQKIVDSINALVDSTVAPMEEEHQIEQSKDDSITNVSCDIRAPLTSIIGYLGLLKNSELNEDRAKYIETAHNKALQMKALAEDLSEYTTFRSSANNELVSAPLRVNSVLEQAAAGFELEAEKKNITFNVVTRPRDLVIDTDAKMIVRMPDNLILNALKYGHSATEINLIASRINNEFVELRVESSGEQIPKEFLQKIFDRFYRVGGLRNSKTGDTGLGLAITKSIVDLYGGTIRHQSTSELTSFIIQLLLNSPKAK